MVRIFFKIVAKMRKRIDPVGYARSIGVRLGSGCRLINVEFGSEPWLVTLGDRVSATDTRFLTHDGGVWVFRESNPNIDRVAPIIVGSNVFIGSGAIILPGVSIGSDVVIGAGSVVSRDIPSSCVAAGVPARPICGLGDYHSRILSKCDATKHLSSDDKKKYYLQKYSDFSG